MSGCPQARFHRVAAPPRGVPHRSVDRESSPKRRVPATAFYILDVAHAQHKQERTLPAQAPGASDVASARGLSLSESSQDLASKIAAAWGFEFTIRCLIRAEHKSICGRHNGYDSDLCQI